MAQAFITDSGTLIIPGAYPTITVQSGTSGLSTTGVLALVGEADAGPDYSLEVDLNENTFGPDQLADVMAKYKTGSLVDAFRGASVPADDPNIVGSPNRFLLVKVNASGKASSALLHNNSSAYALLEDKSYGKLGNLIYYTVTQKTAEVKPTTGQFTYIPSVGTVAITLRANGGAIVFTTNSIGELPNAVQANIDGLDDVDCTGGVDRTMITVTGDATLTLAVVSGHVVTITHASAWDNKPSVGDTLFISSTSVIKGGANQNVGGYVVTAATNNVITATKLSDATKGGAVIGVITNPANASGLIASTTADARCFSPLVITLTGTTIIDGEGKTLEINETPDGTDLLSRYCFALSATPVSWISKTGAPKLLTSAAESAVTLNVNRQFDEIQEELSAGGRVVLKMGYTGTTCTVAITPLTLATTVLDGIGSNFSVKLKDFPTISDLVAYINAQPGYTAAAGTAAAGQLSSLTLDEGTYSAATSFGNKTLLVKNDAVAFYTAVAGSAVVKLSIDPNTASLAGLPGLVAAQTYLSGGTRGATTDAGFQAAVDALEACKLNFVIPLFSRDASLDLLDELTDSSSTYTVDSVNAYAKTHCLKMSTLKKRRNRQAFCSKRDTFAVVRESASNLASYRVSLAFQDMKDTGANGLQQFQPWMTAAKAAGMQAAGFYRAIFNKGINCSGVLQAAGDFKFTLDTNVEDALLSGLLPAHKADDGGFKFFSDQTTYQKDDNFVFNSIQAVYVCDIIALTTAQRMEKAFVGQSVADISAAVAFGALESTMADYLRLKLIAVSDDAPKGFKNAKIKLEGTALRVTAEIKLAGAIYFVPINFLVSPVTQTASTGA